MRLANLDGRAVVTDGERYLDLHQASEGRFGPDLRGVYDAWDDVIAWVGSAGLDLGGGEQLDRDRLGPPSPDPRQIFAIGLNYRDHADESGLDHPSEPPTFTKFLGSFAGPVGELDLPAQTVDWEAELVVIVGGRAVGVSAVDGWRHVAGLTVGQDYSERVRQLTGPAPQFSLGKSYPGFAPQGPWLTTPDELPDPDDLEITCTIDGEVMQHSSTRQLIFDVAELVARLSAVCGLWPGDVIFTGTPAGVGGARDPKRFLRPGEVVETTIAGLGTLRQTCTEGGSAGRPADPPSPTDPQR